MIEWLTESIATPDSRWQGEALQRQRLLTKPPGSLGRLEELAVLLSSLQQRRYPQVDKVWITVFAADHGVVEEGISAFPQSVTAEMVKNFSNGGAAINVLARQIDAALEIVDTGIVGTIPELPGVINSRAGDGTRNFVHHEAMTDLQLEAALKAGGLAVDRAIQNGSSLFIGGEMGIGNTTAASALACAVLDEKPETIVGPGTGLDTKGVARKCGVVGAALERHAGIDRDAVAALRCLGGFEIAALTGACIRCARRGLPLLVDGFIVSASALLAVRINPDVRDWLIFSHRSREPGHDRILAALEADPLLDLSMALGEGSGAAAAVPLLRAACALHREMSTFDEATVSKAENDHNN